MAKISERWVRRCEVLGRLLAREVVAGNVSEVVRRLDMLGADISRYPEIPPECLPRGFTSEEWWWTIAIAEALGVTLPTIKGFYEK